MEDFYINNSSKDKNFDYGNISFDYDDHTNITSYSDDQSSNDTTLQVMNVVEWIIVCSELPLILVAIAAVYSLVGKDHVAPVYVINLLMSDLIQLCCLTAWKAGIMNDFIFYFYISALMASVGFMVCISLERYLMITQPLWYRFRRTIKSSLVVCIMVWILPLVYVLAVYLNADDELIETILPIYFLLPFPLFIFFLVGTIKALSAARSVPADEKRRIVAILVVVLLIYTLIFLPITIWILVEETRNHTMFNFTSSILPSLSPLADMTLYIFIRKGVAEKFFDFTVLLLNVDQQLSSMSDDIMSFNVDV